MKGSRERLKVSLAIMGNDGSKRRQGDLLLIQSRELAQKGKHSVPSNIKSNTMLRQFVYLNLSVGSLFKNNQIALTR